CIPGKRAANSAGITVFQAVPFLDAPCHFVGKAISRARDASSDCLAENEKVRLEIVSASATPRPGANGMGLVNRQQGAMFAGQFAEGRMIAGFRMHNTYVGHDRLS